MDNSPFYCGWECGEIIFLSALGLHYCAQAFLQLRQEEASLVAELISGLGPMLNTPQRRNKIQPPSCCLINKHTRVDTKVVTVSFKEPTVKSPAFIH